MPEQPHRQPWPQPLLRSLAEALRRLPPLVPAAAAARLPATPGTYLLLVRLEHSLPLQGRFTGTMLTAGHYIYTGSARGPGGLRARLQRHFRQEKTIRWHIDQLTTRAAALAALSFPDEEPHAASECELTQTLLRTGAFATPLPGFGSSDCATCPAHLLRWQGG